VQPLVIGAAGSHSITVRGKVFDLPLETTVTFQTGELDLMVNGDSLVFESAEDGKSLYDTCSTAAPCDLKLKAKIFNTGDFPVDGFEIELLAKSNPNYSITKGPFAATAIAPGESKVLVMSATLNFGDQVTVILDPGQKLTESSEGNNSFTFAFLLAPQITQLVPNYLPDSVFDPDVSVVNPIAAVIDAPLEELSSVDFTVADVTFHDNHMANGAGAPADMALLEPSDNCVFAKAKAKSGAASMPKAFCFPIQPIAVPKGLQVAKGAIDWETFADGPNNTVPVDQLKGLELAAVMEDAYSKTGTATVLPLASEDGTHVRYAVELATKYLAGPAAGSGVPDATPYDLYNCKSVLQDKFELQFDPAFIFTVDPTNPACAMLDGALFGAAGKLTALAKSGLAKVKAKLPKSFSLASVDFLPDMVKNGYLFYADYLTFAKGFVWVAFAADLKFNPKVEIDVTDEEIEITAEAGGCQTVFSGGSVSAHISFLVRLKAYWNIIIHTDGGGGSFLAAAGLGIKGFPLIPLGVAWGSIKLFEQTIHIPTSLEAGLAWRWEGWGTTELQTTAFAHQSVNHASTLSKITGYVVTVFVLVGVWNKIYGKVDIALKGWQQFDIADMSPLKWVVQGSFSGNIHSVVKIKWKCFWFIPCGTTTITKDDPKFCKDYIKCKGAADCADLLPGGPDPVEGPFDPEWDDEAGTKVFVDSEQQWSPRVALRSATSAVAVWLSAQSEAGMNWPVLQASAINVDAASAPVTIADDKNHKQFPMVMPVAGNQVMVMYVGDRFDYQAHFALDDGEQLAEGFDGDALEKLVFGNLELLYAVGDGTTFTKPAPVAAGGPPPVIPTATSSTDGVHLAWVADIDADPETITDREVYVARFAGQSWSPAVRLTNDDVMAREAAVGAIGDGTLLVAWAQDQDADPTTVEDTWLEYVVWDPASPQAPVAAQVAPTADNNKAFLPKLAVNADGGLELVAMRRLTGQAAGALPAGAELISGDETLKIYEFVHATFEADGGFSDLLKTGVRSLGPRAPQLVNVDGTGMLLTWLDRDANGMNAPYISLLGSDGVWSQPHTSATTQLAITEVATAAYPAGAGLLNVWTAHADDADPKCSCPGGDCGDATCESTAKIGDDDVFFRARPIAPDLAVERILVEGRRHVAGALLKGRALVKNRGELPSQPDVAVRIRLGVEPDVITTLEALPPGGEVWVPFEATLAPGSQTLSATLQSMGGQVTADNDSKSAEIIGYTDLSIAQYEVELGTFDVKVGQQRLDVVLTLDVAGPVPEQPVDVELFLDYAVDDVAQAQPVYAQPMDLNKSVQLVTSVWVDVPPGGIGTLRAVINGAGDEALPEVSSTNNVEGRWVRILPDLVPTAVLVDVADTIVLRATVANAGPVPATGVDVRLIRDFLGTEEAELGVATVDIPANHAVTVEVAIDEAPPNGTALSVHADPSNAINERDESNNFYSGPRIEPHPVDVYVGSTQARKFGDAADLEVVVSNAGPEDATLVMVALVPFTPGETEVPTDEQRVDVLAADGEVTLTFEDLAPGQWCVVLDRFGLLDDAEISNNRKCFTLTFECDDTTPNCVQACEDECAWAGLLGCFGTQSFECVLGKHGCLEPAFTDCEDGCVDGVCLEGAPDKGPVVADDGEGSGQGDDFQDDPFVGDAGGPSAGLPVPEADGGCGCRAGGERQGPAGGAVVIVLVLLAWALRRRVVMSGRLG